MDKDYKNTITARDNSVNEQKSKTGKDIKKSMDRYEAKIKSGEAPAGDVTSSDE